MTDHSSNKPLKADAVSTRRKILQSLALSGSALAAGKSLPENWKKPVLDQVMLPAHAATTTITGVYTTTSPLAFIFPNQNHQFAQRQFALLDSLVSPAYASHSNAAAFCGNGDNSEFDDDAIGNSDLIIRINEDMSVDFAVTNVPEESDNGVCGGSSTTDGSTIATTLVQFATGADFFIEFSNMQITGSQITGNYQTKNEDGQNPNDDGGGAIDCGGSFVATLGGVFPTPESCEGEP